MDKEKEMVEMLREHLKIAESWNWDINKMCFVDGFLRALNMATGKNYSYSGTTIFIADKNGDRIYV